MPNTSNHRPDAERFDCDNGGLAGCPGRRFFAFAGSIAYQTATTLAAPLGAGYLALSRRHRPLLGRFRSPALPPDQRSPLWVHGCSVGEVGVALPLARAAHDRWPTMPLLLTASTVTGRTQLRRPDAVLTAGWFPFDHALVVRRFLDATAPRALVLIETELWPNVLRGCRARGIPVTIANGRISDAQFRRLTRFRSWVRPMFACIDRAGMQSAEHAARMVALGVPASRVEVTGSLKFDGAPVQAPPEDLASLRAACGLDDAPVLVAGSTRPGDEALVADAWRALRKMYPDLRLVVVPRHVDRADEVARLFTEPVLRRSSGEAPSGEPVVLVDTLGELTAFYALATVAVVGGSFRPGVDGHNPIEPAALGIPAVFGPYMRNFAEPAHLLAAGGGALQLDQPGQLTDAVRRLLADPVLRARMGEQARAVVAANRGATARTLDLLAPFVEQDV